MKTFTFNIIRLCFLMYLVTLISSCGVDVKVKGGTEHVIKIDTDTLDFFRDLCKDAEQDKEEDCIQQLIDLIEGSSKKFDAEDL